MIEKLTEYAMERGVDIIDDDIPFKNTKGLYGKNTIIIQKGLTEAEYRSILAEEVGHYETTVGNILDQKSIKNQKEELKARRWGYDKVVTLDILIECFDKGCRNRFEAAEYIGVTEEFLLGAIDHYKMKYGIGVYKGNYGIMFDPFMIIRMEG